MLPARQIVRQGAAGADERVVLSYDERFLRRKRLVCESGASVMVDLAETVSLEDGDALVTDTGQRVAVVAAQEPVIEVRGPNLARLAWHIGNRHTPCQVDEGHLVIRRDHVLEAMLRGLGADLTPVIAPFRPEGGAYGHGRTMGHDHFHGH
ncbi:urease accessory protein UreE [Tabrizicola fusiformis]|uniref:urease accessory protein UreE n=1 Tax=Tabrizicola sp. SY72 TaxID=2741673 RepID=UPI0015748060|nr:urease accessory protein UreE [Tabrizicola sp. SY72]NTT87774.1 urease accessory protein UreE [Tabrizicola sp. SY72]